MPQSRGGGEKERNKAENASTPRQLLIIPSLFIFPGNVQIG